MESEHSFWQDRFRQQTGWTANTRRYLFEQADILPDDSILEVGCGGGAVLDTLAADGYPNLTGIDIDLAALLHVKLPHLNACADGLQLPFDTASFDHCLCHFYLMWTTGPTQAVSEMVRVTKPGGYVFALAEPDYGGRISHPYPLEKLGSMQTKSLRKQGADPLMGRQVIGLFKSNGLEYISGGIIAAEFKSEQGANAFRQDLGVLRQDLAELMEEEAISELLKDAERALEGSAVLWNVPIFYAVGRVPESE